MEFQRLKINCFLFFLVLFSSCSVTTENKKEEVKQTSEEEKYLTPIEEFSISVSSLTKPKTYTYQFNHSPDNTMETVYQLIEEDSILLISAVHKTQGITIDSALFGADPFRVLEKSFYFLNDTTNTQTNLLVGKIQKDQYLSDLGSFISHETKITYGNGTEKSPSFEYNLNEKFMKDTIVQWRGKDTEALKLSSIVSYHSDDSGQFIIESKGYHIYAKDIGFFKSVMTSNQQLEVVELIDIQ